MNRAYHCGPVGLRCRRAIYPFDQIYSVTPVRYQKPKILLVDLPDGVLTRLRDMGFNVDEGTFGRPYADKRPNNTHHHVVVPNSSLPNLHEQEIIFIDLTEPQMDSNPKIPSEISRPKEGLCILGNSPTELIDARLIVMLESQEYIDRVLQTSGVVVVFLRIRKCLNYLQYQSYANSIQVTSRDPIVIDTWMFSKYLAFELIAMTEDCGTEVSIDLGPDGLSDLSGVDGLKELLERHCRSVTSKSRSKQYTRHTNRTTVDFRSFLKNKYGATVGGVLSINRRGGMILLLPRSSSKSRN